MIASSTCGHLPMAAAAVRPIEFTTSIPDATASIDSFSQAATPDVVPIHSYFNNGIFTSGPTLTAQESWLLVGLGLAFVLPLAQTAYRATRLIGLVDPLRKLPGFSKLLPESERTVESALRSLRSPDTTTFYDRVNAVSGWWMESYGAGFLRIALIIALPLTMQDLIQARYRLVSCALMMTALGIVTYIALRNEGQANRQYLKVASPNLKRFQLLLQSTTQPGARRELQEFNRLIADTVQLRRQMMGIFNYRPSNRAQHIEMKGLTGRHIA